MKFFNNKIIIFLIITKMAAVGEAGAIFLLIAPGAGPAGTGEAQVAKADDAYASYYNPAGLGFQTGKEVTGMHVNWLTNLADDLYYEFLAYKYHIPNFGTLGGHLIFLNLGEQQWMGNCAECDLGSFNSNMWAITTSYGTLLTEDLSFGLNFKVLHQKLGPGAGSEISWGTSTDYSFDFGLLKKTSFSNFGLSISNIGPKIWFKNEDQSDPQPTNMRIGLFSKLYDDGINKLNLLFDINKELVVRYPDMDWNGDGIISLDEKSYDDPWYFAMFTAWVDDWLIGGDQDFNGDSRIGGYTINQSGSLIPTLEIDFGPCLDVDGDHICDDGQPGSPDYVYDNSEPWDDFGSDGIQQEFTEYADGTIIWDILPDADGTEGNGQFDEGEDWVEYNGDGVWTSGDLDSFLGYNDPNYGINGECEDATGSPEACKEKGSKDDRSISTEFKEMDYNMGLEYWYTENFAIRLGYLLGEGGIKNPTFGAGIRFAQYGFDFGYTHGEEGHPRANTMFFSVNINI